MLAIDNKVTGAIWYLHCHKRIVLSNYCAKYDLPPSKMNEVLEVISGKLLALVYPAKKNHTVQVVKL